MIKRPKPLKRGNTVGLVAPSSPTADYDIVRLSVERLMELGFSVSVGDSCYGEYGYLSGKDDVRAGDINKMFADSSIHGIVCLKGGYGTPRILDKLDYEGIKDNPKVFVGYSDITALHIAFNQLCGIVTFHGPMAASDMVEGFDDFSKEGFLKAVTSMQPLGELHNPGTETIGSLVKGKASGTIIGGNLSLIAATLGTPYEIDTKGKLLLIEDIDEEPYKIDRMLSQLRLAGKFEDCGGIIIGDWNNCVPKKQRASLTLEKVFEDIIVPAGKPTLYNLKAGHCCPKITVPFGVEAEIDADSCTLTLKESALL